MYYKMLLINMVSIVCSIILMVIALTLHIISLPFFWISFYRKRIAAPISRLLDNLFRTVNGY